MYAVIATGGKQYRVQEGAVVRVEKLDAEQGANVEFNQVLLVGAGSSVTIGAPYVGTAKVVAIVEGHGKGDKVRIVKFRISPVSQTRTAPGQGVSPSPRQPNHARLTWIMRG